MPSALQLPIIDISSFLTETVDKGARLETGKHALSPLKLAYFCSRGTPFGLQGRRFLLRDGL